MTAPVTPRERDLRALAGMVSEHRTDLMPCGLPMSLLADLRDQIGCDFVTFIGLDSERGMNWFGQQTPAHFEANDEPSDDPLDLAHWEHYWNCSPCSYPDRTGDLRQVVTISDFYSARQWHDTGMYTDLYRPTGAEHELMVTLPAGPPRPARTAGRSLRLFLFRGPGADFSEADRALLTLLRPHLQEAYDDAERRRHPRPELTPRQWQYLELLAAGHTNRQIARQLGVSEGTVRKHLENIYRRLQVSSRTAAVTRAFPSGAQQIKSV